MKLIWCLIGLALIVPAVFPATAGAQACEVGEPLRADAPNRCYVAPREVHFAVDFFCGTGSVPHDEGCVFDEEAPTRTTSGALTCPEASDHSGGATWQLDGDACLLIQEWLIPDEPPLFKCDLGDRETFGEDDDQQVLCFVGLAESAVNLRPAFTGLIARKCCGGAT